ncbi:MAG: DUF6147 family protein [Schaedlerella sp.]|nr:DUF6147 family protein [Schaedlerella sp.]
MRKKIISVVSAMLVMCTMFCSSLINVRAEETVTKMVDGSYLTMAESSTAETAYNPLLRGVHLMDGTVTISKAGVKKIFVYASTTADHDVDNIAVDVFVEEYDPEDDAWKQIDFWSADDKNDYYVVTQKTVYVDGGHYYRVRCDHYAWNDEDTLVDSSGTITDGIWVD